jgi:hypothetical protein
LILLFDAIVIQIVKLIDFEGWKVEEKEVERAGASWRESCLLDERHPYKIAKQTSLEQCN